MSTTDAERAHAIAAAQRIGIALPADCIEGVTLNLRLLERHRAIVSILSKR